MEQNNPMLRKILEKCAGGHNDQVDFNLFVKILDMSLHQDQEGQLKFLFDIYASDSGLENERGEKIIGT